MSIQLDDVHIFDPVKARHLIVNEHGFTPSDLELLAHFAEEMITGQVDVVTVTLEEGVQPSADLNELLVRQLQSIFSPYLTSEPTVGRNEKGNYSPLHVDGERDKQTGKYLENLLIRIHCNLGQPTNSNIPKSYEARQLDPFFIFGRPEKLEISQHSVLQSFEGFSPSLAVNLMNPTWNIFRAHGRHYWNATNMPVSHAVLPRELAEAVFDPDATIYQMVNDDQSVKSNGKVHKVTGKSCPLVDEAGQEIGHFRRYDIVNFDVQGIRPIARTLVA